MGVTTSDNATSDHTPRPNRSATNSNAARNPVRCKTPCIPRPPTPTTDRPVVDSKKSAQVFNSCIDFLRQICILVYTYPQPRCNARSLTIPLSNTLGSHHAPLSHISWFPTISTPTRRPSRDCVSTNHARPLLGFRITSPPEVSLGLLAFDRLARPNVEPYRAALDRFDHMTPVLVQAAVTSPGVVRGGSFEIGRSADQFLERYCLDDVPPPEFGDHSGDGTR